MIINYLNIYNNLIKLTRNKKLYLKLEKNDTFSDRLIILFFHFGFFIKYYKSEIDKDEMQKLFDFIINNIELSIREVGHGDVLVNKKMKELINLFYLIIEKVEFWEKTSLSYKSCLIEDYLNINKNSEYFIDYFEKYRNFLTKNTLNNFSKDILELKF